MGTDWLSNLFFRSVYFTKLKNLFDIYPRKAAYLDIMYKTFDIPLTSQKKKFWYLWLLGSG